MISFTDFMIYFGQWLYNLVLGIPSLLYWLITPLEELSSLVGFELSPLMLIGVGGLTIGIIRAIL